MEPQPSGGLPIAVAVPLPSGPSAARSGSTEGSLKHKPRPAEQVAERNKKRGIAMKESREQAKLTKAGAAVVKAEVEELPCDAVPAAAALSVQRALALAPVTARSVAESMAARPAAAPVAAGPVVQEQPPVAARPAAARASATTASAAPLATPCPTKVVVAAAAVTPTPVFPLKLDTLAKNTTPAKVGTLDAELMNTVRNVVEKEKVLNGMDAAAAKELKEKRKTLDAMQCQEVDALMSGVVELDETERIATCLAHQKLTVAETTSTEKVEWKVGIFHNNAFTSHHAHGGVVVNVLIYGTKEWQFGEPGLPWSHRSTKFDLVQQAGDVLVIPCMYKHQVKTKTTIHDYSVSLSAIVWPLDMRSYTIALLAQEHEGLERDKFASEYSIRSPQRELLLRELRITILQDQNHLKAALQDLQKRQARGAQKAAAAVH